MNIQPPTTQPKTTDNVTGLEVNSLASYISSKPSYIISKKKKRTKTVITIKSLLK